MLQYQPSSQLHPGHRESAANFKCFQSSLKTSSPSLLPHVQSLLHIISLSPSRFCVPGGDCVLGKPSPLLLSSPQNSMSVITIPPHQQIAVSRLAGGYAAIATNGSLAVRKHANHPTSLPSCWERSGRNSPRLLLDTSLRVRHWCHYKRGQYLRYQRRNTPLSMRLLLKLPME